MTGCELLQALEKHINAQNAHEEIIAIDRNNLLCRIKHISIPQNGTDKIPAGIPILVLEEMDVKALTKKE